MFQLPSFFKIRLVALIIGFCILFWGIGFVKWCFAAGLLTLRVPVSCSVISYQIIPSGSFKYVSATCSNGTVITSNLFIHNSIPDFNVVQDSNLSSTTCHVE